MDRLVAAQYDFGDWIQIGIVVLVMAGSILGPITKKLIDAFSPKESGDAAPPGRPLPRAAAAHPVARPTPVSPSARPVAPRPVVTAGPVATAVPVAPAVPQRPKLREASPQPGRDAPARLPGRERQPLPPRPRKVRRRQPTETPPPTSSQPPSRLPQPRESKSPARESREPKTAPSRSGSLASRGPGVEPHLGHLSSRLDDGGERIDARVEAHLGHLQPSTAAATTEQQGQTPLEAFGRPSIRTLRQAVILREILSPPLSLRPPAESL